ncbi:hypothetical protein QYE76_000829 [Lolium multiflorum]|uniref:Hcy-binding domain-containing protein n=1 Tax=Lolium multiflorum TaxID=4521 RepID=A0AAD8RK55_LOLMU|nr:hypothetical protein QYE76_000787 [Lolium multiflorum]KAK1626514.1 hypothetical protein QYE76_000829 [Lolium multiflorum]
MAVSAIITDRDRLTTSSAEQVKIMKYRNNEATIQGFESKGFSKEQSENLLTKSVEIAHEAREMFLKQQSDQSTPMHRSILVAASIGSYGAYLADGSEYR